MVENLQTDKALLIWRDGELIKNQWILNDTGEEILIGRAVECPVHIPVRWISRRHAALKYENGRFVLRDAGSKNGVFVNGQRVVQAHTLNDGDIIQLAPGLELLYVDSEATAPLPGRNRLGLQVDLQQRQVFVHGRALTPPLSPQQYEFLALLSRQPGRVYSRAEIIEAVWPGESPEGITDDAIDALVRRIRQRLAEIEPEHNFIVTVRGYGFRLEPELS